MDLLSKSTSSLHKYKIKEDGRRGAKVKGTLPLVVADPVGRTQGWASGVSGHRTLEVGVSCQGHASVSCSE